MRYFRKIACLSLLIVSAVLTGCIKERMTDAPERGGKPIVFTPSVGKGGNNQTPTDKATRTHNRAATEPASPATRAAGLTPQAYGSGGGATRATTGNPIESGANIPSGGSFGVYAYDQLTAMSSVTTYAPLQNAQVTSGGSLFSYAPVANWPIQSGATLSFYGYYPWRSQSETPAPGDPVIDVTMGAAASPSMTIAYTTPADPAKQVDLMYARTAFMTGFDPVEMVFGHALTRINFTARKQDYTAAVEITKITVRNVLTEGTLTVVDATTPVWNGVNAPVDMTLTATNGLRTGYALTATLAPVINAGADMLVIPQGVAGVVVEVEAANGGEAFPEPFVFPLVTSPDWEMNRIVTYEITLSPDGMSITTKVDDWTTDPVNVVYDGQYTMDLSRDRLDFSKEGGEATLTITTDYDRINAATGAAGSYLDVSGTEGWATVIDLGQTQSGGDYTRTVRITAAAFESVTDRTPTSFKVKAGNMTYIFKLTQSKDSWLMATPEEFYTLDGETKTFPVTAICGWRVAVKAGTNEPVSGNRPMQLLTAGGSAGSGTTEFVAFDDMSVGSIGDATVTLIYSDITGLNPDEEVTVRLVACGCNGRAVALKIGTNGYANPGAAGATYLIHIYGGKCWMVQNSREGTYSSTTYSGQTAGANGYYYDKTLARISNNACPDGWHLPDTNGYSGEVSALRAAVTGTNLNKLEGKWWCGTNGANATTAFAGNARSSGVWSNWGVSGSWWYGSGSQYFDGTGSNMNIDSYDNTYWFSVRCVRD